MKYVIWGFGKRGKSLSILLGKGLVSAFIDSNTELKGETFLDIPVIDYDDYLQKGMQELIIIAVKGHEKSIGEKLKHDGIPWIAMDKEEHIYVLNQIRQAIARIIDKDNSNGVNIVYGYNIYGLYLFELLKLYNRKYIFVLQDNVTCHLKAMIENEIPVGNSDSLKDTRIERVFWAIPDSAKSWLKKKCSKHTNVYEIYKEFDLFYNSELIQFYNIHKGKRCFIIANGPSLKMEDLDKLNCHSEICMAVNGIFKAFHMTDWRPDYYFIDDFAGLVQWKEYILQMNVKEKFISDMAWYFEKKELVKNIHRFHGYTKYSNTKAIMFSDDFSKCSYVAGSIIYDGALQMAAYMGFDEIYMLGADCTVEETQEKQHFVKDYSDDKFSKVFGLNIQGIFNAYESARKYADEHGIKIYNATRGGKLEIFPRVDFDSLF